MIHTNTAALGGTYTDARGYTPDLRWHYCVKGWLRRGEVSTLYGPSNCGKTSLVMAIGDAISRGSDIFGCRVSRGMVVHVAAEGHVSVLERSRAYDMNAGTQRAPYLVREAGIDLSDADAVSAFARELAQLAQDHDEPVMLVIIDTLARSLGSADENCSASMTRVADHAQMVARSVDAHVMLVHHTGKDAGRGSRGSSALRGAIDTEIRLEPQSDGTVRVLQEKQRSMPCSRPVRFRSEPVLLGIDEDGDPRTTARAVILPTASEVTMRPARPAARDGAADRRRAGLEAALADCRARSGGQPVRIGTAALLEKLPEALFDGVAPENRGNILRRLMKELAEAPDVQVTREHDGSWLIGGVTGADRADAGRAVV